MKENESDQTDLVNRKNYIKILQVASFHQISIVGD
jgi:hypothetical protein